MAHNLHVWLERTNFSPMGEEIVASIKQLGSWARVGNSLWYVNSSFTATQARDHIKPFLRDGDKLYVADTTNGEAAWHNVDNEVGSFVRTNWR